MKTCFLCVDCGTTIVKAAVIDEELNILSEASRPVAVKSPFHGANESDMLDVWSRFCEVTKELKEKCPRFDDVAGLGVTGQGDGLWPIDAHGEPVGNALLWNDTRSRDIDFDSMPEVADIIEKNHSNLVFAGSMCALLKWLKLNQPERFSKIHKAIHCKDWINYRLTGEIYTDRSDGSSCVYDHVKGRFLTEVFEAADMNECRDMLPEFSESSGVIGRVSAKAARETGIREGLPVIGGLIDVCAVAVGADAFLPGRSSTIIGTTLSCQMSYRKEALDFADKRGLYVHHAMPHNYLYILPTLSGASTMDYVKALLFPDVKYPALERELEKLPIGCEGLIYHPYISGERAPIKNPMATGGFFGLTQRHTKGHIMRSVFEGLACSFYDCYQVFSGGYDTIYLSGGASISPMVCRLFTDMIGVPCRRVEAKELGTLGIARLLMVGLGLAGDFADFGEQKAASFQPDLQRHEEYLKVYQLFKQLQTMMEPFWKNRNDYITGGHR
ncbi:MAG: FGGY family carbohydrate kinase [Clostridia bacterium]|nr:FGGY family carbohydrate kinase [Clostridia bacterium]